MGVRVHASHLPTSGGVVRVRKTQGKKHKKFAPRNGQGERGGYGLLKGRLIVKSSQVLTPQSCKEQGARTHKEGGMPPQYISLAACPSGRRAGWAMRWFDWLVLNEVPDLVLCLCAQGEGAFLRIAPQRYKSKERPAKEHRWSLHRQ